MDTKPKISIILPCLNEAEAIPECIESIQQTIVHHQLPAEIIVVDNASTDTSAEIVQKLQTSIPYLRLIHEPRRGYGSAYQAGFKAAQGETIVMLDIDTTYDASEIVSFLDMLNTGAMFVIGNRFTGRMSKNAMPWLHRYIGNPILSYLVRLLFGTRVQDVHCGMRAFKKEILPRLRLKTTGMEFASEMVIKALKAHIAIAEVPISYHARTGTSKLRSFADGWRHLRFILLYSPFVLFFIPGVVLFGIGVLTMSIIYFSKLEVLGIRFIVHPIFLSSLLSIIGFQLMAFAGFAKAYAVTHLGEESHFLEKILRYISIEKAVLIGFTAIAIGAAIYAYILYVWITNDFGSLNEIKNAVVGLTLATLGVQVISTSFMASIIGIQE